MNSFMAEPALDFRSPYLVSVTLILLLLVALLFSPLNQQHHISLNFSSSPTSPSSSFYHQQQITTDNHTALHVAPAPSPSQALLEFQRHQSPPSTSSAPKLTHTTIKKSKSKTERIEQELGIARAIISKDIVTKNCTSNSNEIYIPAGSVYRNPYAFHQFKIWAYREGELPMVHNGPTTYIYSIEGQFIFEMESGPSPFMAQHPDEAHAFFLPLSVSKITDFLYRPHHQTFFHRLHGIFTDTGGPTEAQGGANAPPSPERALEVVEFAPQLCHGSAHNLLEEMPQRNSFLFAVVLSCWVLHAAQPACFFLKAPGQNDVVLVQGNETK